MRCRAFPGQLKESSDSLADTDGKRPKLGQDREARDGMAVRQCCVPAKA